MTEKYIFDKQISKHYQNQHDLKDLKVKFTNTLLNQLINSLKTFKKKQSIFIFLITQIIISIIHRMASSNTLFVEKEWFG